MGKSADRQFNLINTRFILFVNALYTVGHVFDKSTFSMVLGVYVEVQKG